MTNRAQRRAAIANAKRAARHGAWGEWEEVPLTVEMRATYGLSGLQRAWRNAVYSVQQFPNATPEGEVTLLMVRRHDAAPVRSWSDMQRIKNDLAGEDRVAVEVYPREEDLVDQANLYHLWVLPAGHVLGFGLHVRDAMRSPPSGDGRLEAMTREDEQTRRTRDATRPYRRNR